MAHNYQRGIDHLATPKTDNPNTYFVDIGCFNNPGGNDSTGDGSSSNPWKTLDFALANTSPFDYIILAPGTYNLNTLMTQRRIIGDTKRKVIINDPLGTQTAFQVANFGCENIVFTNFENLTNSSGFNPEPMVNCIFLDVNNIRPQANAKYIDCIFINTNFSQNSGITETTRCSFFNTIIPQTGINEIRAVRCYFDQLTTWRQSTGNCQLKINNICYVYDKNLFQFNGYSTGIVYDGSEIEEATSPANLNSPNYLDLAVSSDSSLLTGDTLGNVGNFYEGISYGPDQQGFLDAINNNPDIEIVNSEIQPVSSVSIGQTVYTDIFPFIASLRSRLTFWFPVGINDFCEVELQIRTADTNEDINNKPWKSYKQGEQMTQNQDGTSTLEPNYDWGDNRNVDYKEAQGRMCITKIS